MHCDVVFLPNNWRKSLRTVAMWTQWNLMLSLTWEVVSYSTNVMCFTQGVMAMCRDENLWPGLQKHGIGLKYAMWFDETYLNTQM